MSEPVTIDNYSVEVHQRYVENTKAFDPTIIDGNHLIPSHFEIPGIESTISSKWEELFQTNFHRHPFALFRPPPNFSRLRNRFFSYVISPSFNWVSDEKDEKDEEEQQEEEEREIKKYKKKILSKKSQGLPPQIFEKDRTALMNLLDSIQELNGYLREVHGRKLQYQKG